MGLPDNAEQHLKKVVGKRILRHLAVLDGSQDQTNSDTTISQRSGSSSSSLHADSDGNNSGIAPTVEAWLKALPEENSLPSYSTVTALVADAAALPLERFFGRETLRAREILEIVRHDLQQVR